MRAGEIDLADLDVFERGAAWPLFDRLRREAPVHWNPEPAPNAGFWSLTRHADVVAMLRDDETFSSEVGGANLEELDTEQIEARKSMLETDGARHRALRRLLATEFTARRLAGYEAFLRGLTRRTVDAVCDGQRGSAVGDGQRGSAVCDGQRGSAVCDGQRPSAAAGRPGFDFVKQVSADFPIRVLARMLDVPEEHTDRLIAWGNRMVGNTDPEYADVLADDEASEQYRLLPFRSPAALEVFEYGFELAAQRRGGGGADLVSRLVNQVPADGLPLSERDFRNYFLLLVVAGNETTRHAISHTMKALLDHPDQLALLRAEPQRIAGAVEEFLRWATPVYHFRRTATRDVDLHGRTVRAGDKVVAWFASANRDEAVFDDPYRFDVTRTRVDHVTFGKGGPHFCLGSQLARLEIRIMFEELIPRLSPRITGPVTMMRSNFINGIKTFPVTLDAHQTGVAA